MLLSCVTRTWLLFLFFLYLLHFCIVLEKKKSKNLKTDSAFRERIESSPFDRRQFFTWSAFNDEWRSLTCLLNVPFWPCL